MRKFLADPIIETPLIVLQYYKKPSLSIYIYIHKDLYIEKDSCKFIIYNLNPKTY